MKWFGQWLYWTKDVEFGAAKWEEKWKTTEKVYGCNEGQAEGRCDRGGCKKEMMKEEKEVEDSN